jgi:hypothetical protein
MKLADRTVEIHSAGVTSKNQFTISQNAKMFKILSDSLYSDKIMAAIRELSTNANDSHVAAKNPNPFKVTLPTSANPIFMVRDYGTGLSQQDMENLYTTYGASNKNESNDFVGCLGLGSKSPFAYTKSFTTASYFQGKKYTYIAAIDESGVPTLNLFHVSDTSEPNGLEISFAVKQYDFQEFSNKAMRIYHYFKNKPIIEGGVLNNLKDHKYSNTSIIFSGNNWRVCKLNTDNQYYPNTYSHVDSGVVAIMGNIAYPVTTAQIIGAEKETVSEHIQKWNRALQKADIDSWKSFVTEIINARLYLELDFDIGELEMDVSREGLQYTKDVIRTLRNKTQEIYLEMKEEFSKKIKEAKTRIEAIDLYYSMNELAGGWGVGATWTDANGKSHNINTGRDLTYNIGKDKSLYVFNYKSATYRSRRLVCQTDSIHDATLRNKVTYYTQKTGKMRFFVCDMKNSETAKRIVTKYCNDNNCFAYMLLDVQDYTKSGEGFDDLILDVGSDNLLKVSDYKHLTQYTGTRKVSSKASRGSVSDQDVFFIYTDNRANCKSITNAYNDAKFLGILDKNDLDSFLEQDEIVYVPMLRYKTKEGSNCPEISEINTLYNADGLTYIEKDLIKGTNIYAIKDSFADKLKSQGYNLVDFNTFFKQKLELVYNNHFTEVSLYNNLINFCEKEYTSEDSANRYNYMEAAEKQCVFHILNIFGLQYKDFIQNTQLVECIDNIILMEFFAKIIKEQVFSIKRFSKTEYYNHVSKLMKEANISSFDSDKMNKINVAYNSLLACVRRMYKKDSESYLTMYVDTSNKTENSVKLPKISTIRKIVKEELDKNPLLKYIVNATKISGGINSLDPSNNPLAQIITENYYTDRNAWTRKMTDENIDLFKVQLGSVIG